MILIHADFPIAMVIDIEKREYLANLRGKTPRDLATEMLKAEARAGGVGEALFSVNCTGLGIEIVRILRDEWNVDTEYFIKWKSQNLEHQFIVNLT